MVKQPANDERFVETADLDRPAALDEILSIVHHELKNPLSVVYGFSATLMRAAKAMTPDEIVEAAAAIQRAATRMDALLARFKDARDFLGGPTGLDFADVLASDLVSDIVTDVQRTTPDHVIDISVKDDAVLRADLVRMGQVLLNLLANATKFAPSGTPIEVSLERADDYLAISVTDDGPGIPPERVDELFQKFSRVGSKAPGTGLGLFFSRAIARAHHGDLELSTTENGLGCRFKLTLPIHGDAATASLAPKERNRPR